MRPSRHGGQATTSYYAIALVASITHFAVAASLCAQELRVEGLRTEYQQNPVGLDVRAPRMSWRMQAARRGTMQSAYQLRVATDSVSLQRTPLWDSGRLQSAASILRPYSGPALRSGTRYYWQVRVWDDSGRASPWSAPEFWEMGLLDRADWTARWITPDVSEDTTRANPSPMLRREFALSSEIASARLYVTSLGLNAVELNGQLVSDQLFRPGWTSYDKRLQYDTYDVTPLLRPGANALGAILGDGWYRGRLGFEGKRNNYGRRLGLLAQLVVRYADGKTEVVGTDDQWKASTGPILMSDIYDGETYDARLEKSGWSRAGYDDRAWRRVRQLDRVAASLVAPVGPPVRRMQELKPVRILHTPAGETVFDLGQNMVGWVRLKVSGPAGTVVHLRHAEVLDKAGNFYTENLRDASQTVKYTLKGGGVEVYEPHFTFQGFRYVAVDGFPGPPTLDAITGIVIYSDLTPTGTFETSNALVNQLQHNIVWGQRGNFLDIPTDCPQRDERLGWTGDAQVFAPTAAFNTEVSGFFSKWLADVAADQKPDGAVPWVVPDVIGRVTPGRAASAGWSDVAVIVPWAMYEAYGDTSVLVRQYPSMRAWVEYERAQAGDGLLWKKGFHFGDWLAFQTTRADYPGATTDKDLIATAYFAHSTDLFARAAEVLGRGEDARNYRALFERIRAAFQREYVTPTGRLTSNTQTAYVLALDFNLLPNSLRADAARRLAEDVRKMGHLTTGFLGTPALTRMLSENGYLDDAYNLLLNERYPSWLYEVKQGATTVWERWDGQKPDSTFQESSMNSFNHYAYGAVGDWMYRVVAGLNGDPAQPGYKHIVVRPQPGRGFTYATATLLTPYGEAGSGWKIDGDRLRVTTRVPANTRATVYLPAARLERVQERGSALRSTVGVTKAIQSGDAVVVDVGSGNYEFVYDAPALAARLGAGGRR
ncbi:MAG: glycoside hydrolase family 78 protein [Gemmatimonadota bacterium]|nr:glycoside hydrolase family 78 protein [Gemmatimonadota bacterium]